MAVTRPGKRVVILAQTNDPHLPFVTKHMSHEPIIVDIGRMVKDGLSYEFDAKNAWPRVNLGGRSIDLGSNVVQSVWYRNIDFSHLGPNLPIKPEYAFLKDSSLGSLTRMGHALERLFHPGILWVSKRAAIQMAELKPYQLVKARLAGFNVPKTLYTTAPDAALQFVRQQGVCALKPLAPYPPEHYGQPTRILRYKDDLNLQGVSVQAHIFQELVDPQFEIRVAVVGTEVFAAKVWDNKQAEAATEGIRDYRRGVDTDTFEAAAHTLPSNIAESCVRYVRSMDLMSGYFDLIVDKQGVYWFLECNPNGQWAFVDDKTVEGIGRALARLLESGVSPWPLARNDP